MQQGSLLRSWQLLN